MSDTTPNPNQQPDPAAQPVPPAPQAQPGQPSQPTAPAYGEQAAPGQFPTAQEAPGAPYTAAPDPAAQQPYGHAPAPTSVPGRTLGIVGLVVSIIFPIALIGLILSIVALVQSRKVKLPNIPAVIGIIIGAIGTAVGAFMLVLGGIFVATVGPELGDLVDQSTAAVQLCEQGAETVEVAGQTISCEELLP